MEYTMKMDISKIARIFLAVLLLALPQMSLDRKTAVKIENEISAHIEEIIKARRFLHMNPELGNREEQTARLIASRLLSYGLEVKTGIAKTGVTGLLRGDLPGITIGMRADMDALPIQEQTTLTFRSLNPGVMHACGHDIHMAVALGTAKILSAFKDQIKGNIKFIFQPAEEGAPKGEEGGAGLMITQGVLENPPVRTIFGMHVWPETPSGKVRFSTGPIMAAADSFEILIRGKSAHGARPHEGIDAIALAAQIVMSIHTTMNRIIDPADPAIVTIGKIEGGVRSNIIAETVRLSGTVRTLTRTNRDRIEILLENITESITKPAGAGYTFEYLKGAPPVYNHPEMAEIVLPAMKGALGNENVLPLRPQMISEDFSLFSQTIPGVYLFLGVKPPGAQSMPPLHSPNFSPDEKSISVGIKVFCWLLLEALEHQSKVYDSTF